MGGLALWWFLLYLLLVGMAAGWFAWVVLGRSKALTQGRKPNWALILGLGVVGSFVGGMGTSLLLGQGLQLQAGGMIASAIGAIAVVAVYLGVKK